MRTLRTPGSTLRRVLASVAALVGVGAALPGCSSAPPPPIAIQSPVATTLSWFKAVNAHNMPLAQEHFVRADRGMMDWASWGPAFTDLRCHLRSGHAKSANVYCSFSPITDADTGMSGDAFWDVYLQREPSGRWLINNYGQG